MGFPIHVTVKFVNVSVPPCAMRRHTCSSDTYTTLNICFVSHLTSHSTSTCTPYARGGWILRGYSLPKFPPLLFGVHPVPLIHHLTCPGHGVWRNVMTTQFKSREAAIKVLSERSDVFWCMHCSRGLFFPKSCSDHPLVQ